MNTAVLVKRIDPKDFPFADIWHYEGKILLKEVSSHKKRSGYCLQSGIFQVQAMRLKWACPNSEVLQILQMPFSLKASRRKRSKVTGIYPIWIISVINLANLQAIYFNCPRSIHSSNLALFNFNHSKMKVENVFTGSCKKKKEERKAERRKKKGRKKGQMAPTFYLLTSYSVLKIEDFHRLGKLPKSSCVRKWIDNTLLTSPRLTFHC